jgi:hypothetical protein
MMEWIILFVLQLTFVLVLQCCLVSEKLDFDFEHTVMTVAKSADQLQVLSFSSDAHT